MLEDRFATLREWFTMPPESHVWREICALLRTWPESEKEAALDYAGAHFAGWPASLRRLSLEVEWPHFPFGEPSALWRLGRSLSSSELTHSVCVNDAAWRALRETPYLSQIEHLAMSTARENPIDKLWLTEASGCLSGLESIEIECLQYEPWLLEALSSFHRLRSIRMRGRDSWALLMALPAALLCQLSALSYTHEAQADISSNAWTALEEGLADRLDSLVPCTDLTLRGVPARHLLSAPMMVALHRLPLERLSLCTAGADPEDQRLVTDDMLSAIPLETLSSLSLDGWNAMPSLVGTLTKKQDCSALRELSLRACFDGPEALTQLCHWTPFTSLSSLDLSSNPLRNQGVRRLCSQVFPALKTLRLRDCSLSLPAGTALASTSCFPALTTLDLCDNDLRSVGARALAQASHLQSLRRLLLAQNHISWTGFKAFAESEGFPAMGLLTLQGSEDDFEGESLRALSHFSLPQGVWELSLSSSWGHEIDTSALSAFAKWEPKQALHALSLGRHHFSVEGVKQLIKAKHLSSLFSFDLNHCRLDAQSMVLLADADIFARLEQLSLRGNAFGDDGVKALCRARWGHSVLALDIAYCGMGDEGLGALLRSEAFPELRSLSLEGNELSLDGMLALIRAPQLSRLSSLCLGYESFAPDEAERLRESARRHKPWLCLVL